MAEEEKQGKYIMKLMETRDYLYYLTEPSRVATMFWMVNSLRILRDPNLHEVRPAVLKFLKSCLNSDGGFGGNVNYPSTINTTFHALQILFIYNVPFYWTQTLTFISSMQDSDGSVVNYKYGEKDTRLDCCAVLSLHILNTMRSHITNNPEIPAVVGRALYNGKIEFDELNHGFKPNFDVPCFYEENKLPIKRDSLRKPVPSLFLAEAGFDKEKFHLHLLRCYNPDGGFGQLEGSESHAAQIFCVLASLRAIGRLDTVDLDKIESFLLFRQTPSGGFSGRINKKEDVCYSFWIIASLSIIGSDLYDSDALENFILSCEGHDGGFSDRPGNECDPYHQMFSLAALNLLGYKELGDVDPGFSI